MLFQPSRSGYLPDPQSNFSSQTRVRIDLTVLKSRSQVFNIHRHAALPKTHPQISTVLILFNADFVSAHFITSTLFLPLYIIPEISAVLSPPLSLANRLLLLHTYPFVTAAWYVSHGRAPLPISQSLDAISFRLSTPLPPQRKSTVPESDCVPALWPGEVLGAGGNPWLRILQDTMVHPDMHPLQSAAGARVLGRQVRVAAGGILFLCGRGLAGFERLDGTLFVRVASLVEEQMGWAAEGAELHLWDCIGFLEGREPRAGIFE